jgi:hypothetical protein
MQHGTDWSPNQKLHTPNNNKLIAKQKDEPHKFYTSSRRSPAFQLPTL